MTFIRRGGRIGRLVGGEEGDADEARWPWPSSSSGLVRWRTGVERSRGGGAAGEAREHEILHQAVAEQRRGGKAGAVGDAVGERCTAFHHRAVATPAGLDDELGFAVSPAGARNSAGVRWSTPMTKASSMPAMRAARRRSPAALACRRLRLGEARGAGHRRRGRTSPGLPTPPAGSGELRRAAAIVARHLQVEGGGERGYGAAELL